MDLDNLRLAVESARYASMAVAFLAGFVFSFNPVALASIPVSLAYVTRARERRTALAFGAMFILGLVLTHVVLGAVAGLGGRWVERLLGRYWGVVLGPLLIVLGLFWAGWLKIPLPSPSFKARRVTGAWGAFALGIPFAVAICPACTPALVVLLGVVAGIGSPVLGAAVLLAFALGRAVPVALGAVAIGWLDGKESVGKFVPVLDKVGAVVLIATGLYLVNAYYFFVPGLAG